MLEVNFFQHCPHFLQIIFFKFLKKCSLVFKKVFFFLQFFLLVSLNRFLTYFFRKSLLFFLLTFSRKFAQFLETINSVSPIVRVYDSVSTNIFQVFSQDFTHLLLRYCPSFCPTVYLLASSLISTLFLSPLPPPYLVTYSRNVGGASLVHCYKNYYQIVFTNIFRNHFYEESNHLRNILNPPTLY